MITRERVMQLVDYDPLTGVMTRRCGRMAGKPTGSSCHHGHLQTKLDGKLYYVHRLAWLICNGSWPLAHIDHINGNSQDNRIANLRDVDRCVNQQNRRRARSDSRTGVRGVTYSHGKYKAYCQRNGKRASLGAYSTLAEAAEVARIAQAAA